MTRFTRLPGADDLADTARREAGDLRLALGVLREPFAWLAMLVSVAAALLLFALLAVVLWWLGGRIPGLAETSWGPWFSGGLGAALGLLAAWFLFPVVVTATAGIFLEPLADRVERRHYPELPAPRAISLGEQIRASLRALLRGIGWNLLALPLYCVPVVNLAAYAYVNARLLSREYFQVVALRHLPMDATRELYRRHHWPLIRGGLLLMPLFVLPLVQLIAPLLATAWMIHRLWRRNDSPLRATLLPPASQPQAHTA